MLYASRHILVLDLKNKPSESFVLSVFNYCDVVYGNCINSVDNLRIQRFKGTLFSLCASNTFILQPFYLFDRLESKSSIHSKNIRFSHILHIPKHKSALFKKSFSYCAANFYNKLSDEMKNLPSGTLKIQLKDQSQSF